ncbi:2,4-dihydroxyhept-2-enedioate aldolase (plasmid) [Deinococcus geothermalis DSM 11300]|uniref:2,4-dihydroxyhept-2-enedioate aldolase n=1 Tax=Deinococcus geothermalis (strain DSM 11300 / CIP 105573 / AG-3a) TaxID=319795 RepID=Q1J3S9_DEIGD|nr:4-hydroxy-2-oxoheptanedioate aldolase [Deinococcus geothermalis]ABF43855.1 2,4-dihydroxyhept-2-enedioate aldolase [Deinococcus geothermalis DSM 11300]MBI0447182.1 4-hydroxy-2-oxoheptanedioate aldolase [Deinococcus sp. DB0503]
MGAENTFKVALSRGDTLYGFWLALADAYSSEVCAGAGFDWLVIDGEHAPNDLRSILRQLQAIAPYPSAPVVRPPVGDPVLIKQLLDIGARNLLIPMVETATQARELVAATRYPPRGIRGVGSALARASAFSRDTEYLKHADEGVCLLLQVESVTALEVLDEIAAVEGVDGVFVGPADLAASFGHLGNPGHPEVQAAIRVAAGRIRAAGKAAGILATDEGAARRYLEWGYSFVAVGVDVTLLARASTELLARFRS